VQFRSRNAVILLIVHREEPLRRAYEVAIGMAHPELSHMPGIVGKRARNIHLSLLSLTIDGVHVIDEEHNFHATAALSRWEQVWTLSRPVWRV
jgi:hypothetical protein